MLSFLANGEFGLAFSGEELQLMIGMLGTVEFVIGGSFNGMSSEGLLGKGEEGGASFIGGDKEQFEKLPFFP